MRETRQLHPTLAREVVGLRLWEPLDEAAVAELRALYAAFGVLVFRRQALSEAELELHTPGLRAGYYLCFFGIHVFTPAVFNILQKQIEKNEGRTLLTPALQELAEMEQYLALEVKGSRYDPSRKHGLLRAQIALGLAGESQSEMLTTLVESLAEGKKLDHFEGA